ncbi:MAG: LLM class flavin-dependent oxidoreductase [Armatimonadetes bacterium]|nr:LLM class flavin-dependent oxidoreductase [Armatimonadota bacterium]
MDASRLGLSLPNRGVLFGAITVPQILALSEAADRAGCFNSVWVGDSILTKPRLEALMLLATIAGRTGRVRLGPACLASFPLRNPVILAYQWASLDVISNGRAVMVACIGATHTAGARFAKEYATLGVDPRQRVRRLEEGIEAMRLLWSQENASYHGRFVNFDEVTLEPRPVQRPAPPIWIASNPRRVKAGPEVIHRMFDRVGRLADGWMTAAVTPREFAEDWAQVQAAARRHGRDPAAMESAIHHMVNIGDDAEAAYQEGKRFLDTYYTTDYAREFLEGFLAYGPPERVAEKLTAFLRAGIGTVIVRLASWDPTAQMTRLLDEVVPRVEAG